MRNNIVALWVLLLFIVGCTSEPDEFNFRTFLKNESSNKFTVNTYFNSEEITSIELNNSESIDICNYISEVFGGFSGCTIDSISIVFESGKGYSCDILPGTDDNLCFQDKNPFLGSENFRNIGNNDYEFVITEEDFNNAHDLPE